MRDPFRPFDPFRLGAHRAGLASLFAGGQPGHWPNSYDPAFGRLFQDAAGAIPVTAPGQPVGLVLDLSQGGGRGLELRGTGYAASVGSPPIPAAYDPVTGVGIVSRGASASNTAGAHIDGLVVGHTYMADIENTGAGTINLRQAALTGSGYIGVAPSQRVTCYIVAQHSRLVVAPSTNNVDSTFLLHSIRLVPGNHASQATALSRPTLDVSGGIYHLYNDGGDSLPITLPAGTYGRATVDAAGAIVVDTVVDPTSALAVQNQRDIVLRQGAFTAGEEAQIRAYWARYAP